MKKLFCLFILLSGCSQSIFLPADKVDAEKIEAAWKIKEPASRRCRCVILNSRYFVDLPKFKKQEILLPLFNDLQLTACVEEETPKEGVSRAFAGEIKGCLDSMVIIILRNNILVAHIRTIEHGLIEIRPCTKWGNFHIISQIDESKLPACGN